MSDHDDYEVPPLNWRQVDNKADHVRSLLHMDQRPRIDIVRVVENVICGVMELSEFQIRTKSEMGNTYGLTCPKGSFIRFREDVYEDACNGDARARFTFAHELGHLLLHQNAPMARASRQGGTPAFRLAEPQANRFAATLLMPAAHISRSDTATDLVERFGVSLDAASNRLSDMRKRGDL